MIKFDLDLDYLKTFQAVADFGSMHRAAEERHMTQPAVTRQMAILSREVGVPLFRRFGRGVRLTEAGIVLLRESRGIFKTVEEGLRRVRETDGKERLRLSLGSSHYVASNALAEPVRTFRKSWPEVRIDFVCGSSEAMAEKVRQGELDLAVATLPDRSEGLRRLRLWTDTFVAALPLEDPRLGKERVSLEELVAGAMLLPPLESTTRLLIDRALRKSRIRPDRIIELDTLEEIAAGVAMGLGAAILPVRLLSPGSVHIADLAVRPIEGFGYSRDLGILLRKGKTLSPSESALIALLEEKLSERGQETPAHEKDPGQ
ncbi:MAG: LysR family transcriptional regulator [Nitrospirae bacterium]|nr:LysR family transcriptional regulator [Nitrospirota bacterium]